MLRFASDLDRELSLTPWIAERAEEVRKGWSEAERLRRCCFPAGDVGPVEAMADPARTRRLGGNSD